MKIQKLKVLADVGAILSIEVLPESRGWAVGVRYTLRGDERHDILERQRGGPRFFATLEAVARCVAAVGLVEFWVQVRPP